MIVIYHPYDVRIEILLLSNSQHHEKIALYENAEEVLVITLQWSVGVETAGLHEYFLYILT